MPAVPLSQALNALSGFLVADATIGDTLDRVAQVTQDAVPGASFVGMSLLDERGRPTTSIFTDLASPQIDEAQYATGLGPCLDAWREQRRVRVDDLEATEPRYEAFAHAALDHGIRSTLSMPLVAAEQGMGAMNLYATSRCAFSQEDEAVAGALATAASVVVANSVAYWGALELTEQLSSALESRAVIEQAKGMLMARSPELTADDAFDLLRQASQRENVKLREIARRVVSRRVPAEDR